MLFVMSYTFCLRKCAIALENIFQGLFQFNHVHALFNRLLSTALINLLKQFEPRHEKTGFLHMRKQKSRSPSR